MKWWTAWWKRWKFPADRIVPTPRGASTFAIIGLVLLVIGSLLFVSPWLDGFILLLLSVLMGIDWYRLRRVGTPEIERTVAQRQELGIATVVRITVNFVTSSTTLHNSDGSRWFPRQMITRAEIDDGAPFTFVQEGPVKSSQIGAGSFVFWSAHRPVQRGGFSFAEVDIRWSSPFGFWTRMYRGGGQAFVRVLPDVTTWQRQVAAQLRASLQEGRHVRLLRSGDSDFAHISEHTFNDDPRHVNWSATARKGRIMKNVYQPEQGQQVVIAVDASRYMGAVLPDGKTRLDWAVEGASALAHAALAMGDSVGVVAFAKDVLVQIPSRKGSAQWSRIVEGLADLKPQGVQGGYQALFRGLLRQFKRRGLLIVLSELEGLSTDAAFLPTMVSFQRRHPTLFVSMKPVHIEAVLGHAPSSIKGTAEWASAEWILADRDRSAQELQTRGVTVVESLPRDLVVDAVNQYLRRRQRFVF